MPTELTDEEVFSDTQEEELSDDEVFANESPPQDEPERTAGQIEPGSFADRLISNILFPFGGEEEAKASLAEKEAKGEPTALRPSFGLPLAKGIDALASKISGDKSTLTDLLTSSTRDATAEDQLIPEIPQQEGTVKEIAAGAANVPIRFTNFALSPEGVALGPALGIVGKGIRTLAGALFAAEEVRGAVNAESTQEVVSHLIGAAAIGAGTIVHAKEGSGKPGAKEAVERVEKGEAKALTDEEVGIVPEVAAVEAIQPKAKIVSTAITDETGKIVTGDSWNAKHDSFTRKALEEGVDPDKLQRGFIAEDAKGERHFVDREEAAIIARDAGQSEADITALHSENLKAESGPPVEAVVDPATQRAEETRLKTEHEQGLLSDFQEHQAKGGDEFIAALEKAGGLPALSSVDHPFGGELNSVRNEFAKEFGGKRVGGDYNKIFKKEHHGDIDRVTQNMKAAGFNVETPADLIELTKQRVRSGKPIYGEEARANALEEASFGVAAKVDDFIPSPQALGITPFKGRPTADRLSTADVDLKSTDPKVESRWKDATRTEATLAQKAKSAAIAVKNEFTRADPHLDPKTDATWIDATRRFRTIPRHSQELAANIIRGFTAGFGKNKFELFQRNIILSDLARDVEAGRYSGRELPFGYTPESLKSDVGKFRDLARLNPAVAKAIQTRNRFMDTLKKELVENGLLSEKVMEEGDYFHRQVVEFLNAKESFTTGTGSGDVRTHTKGFQKERTHSSKDYNTKYLEAEYEVVSQALGQLRTKRALEEFKQSDIKPKLQEEAKAANEANPEGRQITWENLVPEDHVIWQPKEGNVFYAAMTIPEKIIDGILKGDRQFAKEDLREILAMGGKREQWVVPKRLAKSLDNISPKSEEGVISQLAQKATNAWKVWVLLNPARSIKYGLNNLSGDADIALAYSPKIVSNYGAKAAKDMHRYVIKRGALTPEISEGIEKGVLSSGFSVAEVPDINAHQFFRVMTGENVSVIERAWQKNKDYHNWRENTLRLAAWRYFKDKMAGAKEGERFYGASRKTEIDGLYDAGKPPADIAAKLSRELIGDYGNISSAGQWIRSHAIPFYSWMEINAPRYVRLLKNAASEGEGNLAARVTGVVAKRTAMAAIGKTAKTAGLAAGMYALVNLWNHSFFPKEEEELGEGRRQLHLILGRNEDGTIRTLRIQGALSDALSWIGAEDLPSDIRDVASGKETIGDKALDAAKAPATKLISGVTPFIKTPAEALTRRSLFPDPLNPRPIRDPAETIAQMFSLEKPYRYFTDKPMRPVMNEIADLVTYTTDPGEAAYHMTRGLVAGWQSKQGDERSSTIPTSRQNALFYYKKATQLGETEKADRWKERYFKMGGEEKGIDQSVKASSPFGMLSKERREEFLSSLTPKEREVADRAEQWYLDIYGEAAEPKTGKPFRIRRP